jgi:MFS family permease
MSAPVNPQGTTVTVTPEHRLTGGTLTAAVVAVAVAQIGLSLPAVLNGLFQVDLATSSTQLTWISDAFLVPVTLFELTFGVLGDLFGRKRLLAIGAALMVVGGLVAFFTPGTGSTVARVAQLWTGQAITGLGAAAIFPTSVAMLAAGTHTVKARAHALSVWAAALTGAGFVSPVLSGLVSRISHSGGPDAGWRWAFLAVAVLAAISVAATLAWAANSSAPQGRSLDIPGQILIAIALFALLYAVIQGAGDGWTSGLVLGGFAVAVVFLAAFVVVELRVRSPLIRLDLFSNRIFVGSAVVTVIGMFAYLGTAYTTSIRISAIQGYSPLVTSIGFICLNVMGVVLFPVSSQMIQRYNAGLTLAVGMLAIGAGDLWLAAIPATNPSVGVVAVPLLIVGIGFKLAVTTITVVAVNSVPTDKAGMASGATSMLRDFGLTLGPAIIGAVALSNAAGTISARLAASPPLRAALAAFNASPNSAPPALRPQLEAAVGAVQSGPLGANAVPATATSPTGQTVPLNPLKDIAFHALSDAYATGYLICGISAVVAAIVAASVLAGRAGRSHVTEDEPSELDPQTT